jgi:predicted nucleic acid-binding protein
VATSLVDEIPVGAAVGIDTNVFIYFIETNPEFLAAVEPLFMRIDDGSLVAHVSAITLTEVLIKPLRQGRTDLGDQYRRLLRLSENVNLHGIDEALADAAGVLAATYGLRTPDAIVCSTALRAGCAFMVTNDDKFDRVAGIRTLKVSDYV